MQTVHLDCREKCECGYMRNEHALEADISNQPEEQEWKVDDSHTKIVATDAFGKVKFESDSTSTPPRWVVPFR